MYAHSNRPQPVVVLCCPSGGPGEVASPGPTAPSSVGARDPVAILAAAMCSGYGGLEAISIAAAHPASPTGQVAERRLAALLSKPATRAALLNEVVRCGSFSTYEHVAQCFTAAEAVTAFRLAARLGRGDFALRILGGFEGELFSFVGSAMREEALESAALSRSIDVLQAFARAWRLGPADATRGGAHEALKSFCESATIDSVSWIVSHFVLSEVDDRSTGVERIGFGVGANPEIGTAQLLALAHAAFQYGNVSPVRVSRAAGFVESLLDGAIYAGKTTAVCELMRYDSACKT